MIRRGMVHLILVVTLGLAFTAAVITWSTQVAATTTHIVTSGADSGPGTLRQAVIDAAHGDTIEFDSIISTITLTSGQITLDKSLNIIGPGPNALAIIRDSNANPFRIFHVEGEIVLSGLAIAGGADIGGGVFNEDGLLHIINCLLTNNNGGTSGAILNRGTLQITNSTLSGNSANNFGGALVNMRQLVVVNSTFSGNTVFGAGSGGAISNFSSGAITIINSTLSGNSAGTSISGGRGGGISNFGTLIISNSTVCNNSAGIEGGGGINNESIGTLSLSSCIVANNASTAGPDIQGTVNSGDYNLIEDISGISGPLPGSSNITGSDPMVAPLSLNGGPTQTHALLCGSPALDKGHSFSLTTDQRGQGFTRAFDVPWIVNVGDGTDIGAVEVQQGCTPSTVDLYLRSTDDLSILFLDQSVPTETAPQFKDSSSLSRNSGNQWREVGTWSTVIPTPATLTALSDAHLWLGLKNSSDQGTRFDIRCEVYKNSALIAWGEQFCITGVTENPVDAKEVAVLFGPMSPVVFVGTDVLSLKVLARIGTNGNGGPCGGRSNATGLRLSFDAIGRLSRFSGAP